MTDKNINNALAQSNNGVAGLIEAGVDLSGIKLVTLAPDIPLDDYQNADLCIYLQPDNVCGNRTIFT